MPIVHFNVTKVKAQLISLTPHDEQNFRRYYKEYLPVSVKVVSDVNGVFSS